MLSKKTNLHRQVFVVVSLMIYFIVSDFALLEVSYTAQCVSPVDIDVMNIGEKQKTLKNVFFILKIKRRL